MNEVNNNNLAFDKDYKKLLIGPVLRMRGFGTSGN